MVENLAKAQRVSDIRGVQSRDQFLEAVEYLDTLETVDLYYNNRPEPAKNRVGLMNMRTEELVGVASDKWRPVNHRDAFRTAISSISEVVGRDDFYGRVINNGNIASIEVLFGNHTNGDNLAFGLRVSNNYKVGTVLKIESLFIRSACTNGMLWSDNTASMSLNHINTLWIQQIGSGVFDVVDRLEQSGRAIGSHIDNAKKDSVDSVEKDRQLRDILEFYLSKQGLNRLQKGDYSMNPNSWSILYRYDLYNMLTAYATHLQQSPIRFEEIQKGAQHVLKTPFSVLIEEADARLAAIDAEVTVLA